MKFQLWPMQTTPDLLSQDRDNIPGKETIMSKQGIYVEQRPDGDFAVRREDSKRASAVKPTQDAEIKRAREIEPGGKIHVERVRNVGDGRDKFRKA